MVDGGMVCVCDLAWTPRISTYVEFFSVNTPQAQTLFTVVILYHKASVKTSVCSALHLQPRRPLIRLAALTRAFAHVILPKLTDMGILTWSGRRME